MHSIQASAPSMSGVPLPGDGVNGTWSNWVSRAGDPLEYRLVWARSRALLRALRGVQGGSPPLARLIWARSRALLRALRGVQGGSPPLARLIWARSRVLLRAPRGVQGGSSPPLARHRHARGQSSPANRSSAQRSPGYGTPTASW